MKDQVIWHMKRSSFVPNLFESLAKFPSPEFQWLIIRLTQEIFLPRKLKLFGLVGFGFVSQPIICCWNHSRVEVEKKLTLIYAMNLQYLFDLWHLTIWLTLNLVSWRHGPISHIIGSWGRWLLVLVCSSRSKWVCFAFLCFPMSALAWLFSSVKISFRPRRMRINKTSIQVLFVLF